MKQLSYWGSQHKVPARLLIIFSFLLMVPLAIFTGRTLEELGQSFPAFFCWCFFFVLAIGLLAYPSRATKKLKGSQWYYRRQKSCDVAIASFTFCLLLFYGNRPTYFTPTASVVGASVNPRDSAQTFLTLRDFSRSLRDEAGHLRPWKERKQLLKQQVKNIKHASEPSRAGKTLLVILSILLALGLLSLVAALACGISCNGSAAGAAIVGILGTGLVIFLFILAIRGIYGRRHRRPRELHPPADAS